MEACERAETGDRAWFAALDDEDAGEGGSKLVEALRSRDDDGRTAFHRACASGARGREVVRLALDRMSKEDAKRVVNAACLLYTSPSPRDKRQSRMPSSA